MTRRARRGRVAAAVCGPLYVTFYLRLGMLDSACKSVGNLWRTFVDLSPLWRGKAIGRVSPLVVMEGINEEEEGSRVSGSEPEQ